MSPACRPRHAPLSRTKLNTSWAFPTLLRRIAPAAGGHANCVMMKIWATMSTTLPSQNRAHARLGETLARIEVIGVGLCADLGAARREAPAPCRCNSLRTEQVLRGGGGGGECREGGGRAEKSSWIDGVSAVLASWVGFWFVGVVGAVNRENSAL